MFKNKSFLTLISLLLALLPAILLAFIIVNYSVDLPRENDWEVHELYYKKTNGNLSIADLFKQHNQSRPFFPRLVLVSIGDLTHLDTRYQILLSFLLACAISCNVYLLCRMTVSGERWSCLLLLALANLLIFGPVQGENWLLGKISLFIPMACITTALVICCSSRSNISKVFLSILLCSMATYSFAIGMVSWILLFPVLFLEVQRTSNRPKTWMLLYLFGMAINLVLYFWDYGKQAQTSFQPDLFNLYISIRYFLTFLGAPLSRFFNKTEAIIPGVLMFCLLLGCVVYIFNRDRKDGLWRKSVPWLTLAGYSLISGMVTTLGRVGFGVNGALSDRYTTHSAYLPVSLIFLLAIIYRNFLHPKWKNTARALTVTLLTFSIVSHSLTSAYGIHKMPVIRQNRCAGRTILALTHVLPHHEVFPDRSLSRVYLIKVIHNIRKYRKAGTWRLPFVEDRDMETIRGRDRHAGKDCGTLVGIRKIGDDRYEAYGRAWLPWRKEPVHAVLLAYTDSQGRQILFEYVLGPCGQRLTELSKYGKDELKKWRMSFSAEELPPGDVMISAWAYDALSGKAYPLNGFARVIR